MTGRSATGRGSRWAGGRGMKLPSCVRLTDPFWTNASRVKPTKKVLPPEFAERLAEFGVV